MPPLKRLKQRSSLDPSFLATRREPTPPKSLIIKLPIRFHPPPPTITRTRKLITPKVRFKSPIPDAQSEPDTIHKVRQQCWLLDQLRIYGPIVEEQKAEIARIEDETGESPDMGGFECPYILSEFSIQERHRVGLPEDEELEFLLEKRGELEREVIGEDEDELEDAGYGGEDVGGDEVLSDGEIDMDVNEYVGADEVWDRPVYEGKSLAAVQRSSFPPAPTKAYTKVVKKRKRRKVSFDGTFVPEPLEDDCGVHIKPKRKPRIQKAVGAVKKPAGAAKKPASAAKTISNMDGAEEDTETEDGEFEPAGEVKPQKRQTLLTAGRFGKVTKNLGGEKLAIKGNINLSFRK